MTAFLVYVLIGLFLSFLSFVYIEYFDDNITEIMTEEKVDDAYERNKLLIYTIFGIFWIPFLMVLIIASLMHRFK